MGQLRLPPINTDGEREGGREKETCMHIYIQPPHIHTTTTNYTSVLLVKKQNSRWQDRLPAAGHARGTEARTCRRHVCSGACVSSHPHSLKPLFVVVGFIALSERTPFVYIPPHGWPAANQSGCTVPAKKSIAFCQHILHQSLPNPPFFHYCRARRS